MNAVFVSYAHRDEEFVDQLMLDLQYASVPATYDKWLLRVGDSIVERIAETVADSAAIVTVISPASLESHWVKKELSLAISGELERKRVTVLPVLLDGTRMPPVIADKRYADFRGSYFHGMRDLLRALAPENYDRLSGRFKAFGRIEADRRELEKLLGSADAEEVRTWFKGHGYALAILFGKLWSVSEAIPDFQVPGSSRRVDFMVVNGQSFRYEFAAVQIGPPVLGADKARGLNELTHGLEHLLNEFRSDHEALRRAVALRLSDSYGAEQIYPTGERGRQGWMVGSECVAKVLAGRRRDYGPSENQARNSIYEASNQAVEVVTYDRFLEALSKYR